jgi:hypothetical protein
MELTYTLGYCTKFYNIALPPNLDQKSVKRQMKVIVLSVFKKPKKCQFENGAKTSDRK